MVSHSAARALKLIQYKLTKGYSFLIKHIIKDNARVAMMIAFLKNARWTGHKHD